MVGPAPGRGGHEARNLQPSSAETPAVKEKSATERVWDHLRYASCPAHQLQTSANHLHPTIHHLHHHSQTSQLTSGPPCTIQSLDTSAVTTSGEYGRFPRGSEAVGRAPVYRPLQHVLDRSYAGQRYRNHSFNL
ncbi:uncharacterized protein LOC108669761 [Hyalella azteca]|uniref:Uncharacterized protein LOC108669761 n=1 Tax=Hyalella azteca TaxID=294128 RepID=A0A8B7NGA2_HYAAZ|nr:uncharacterized protein LOC108669761 [Hyalella azteca]XP_047741360.1 uncharacterized protein LOC108669761 [Hyalella azteca]